MTALDIASQHESTIHIARLLIETRCDVNNVKSRNRLTSLHYAANMKNSTIFPLLIEAGCEINAKDYQKRTALQFCEIGRSLKCVNILVNAGAKFQLFDSNHKLASYVVKQLFQKDQSGSLVYERITLWDFFGFYFSRKSSIFVAHTF